MVDRKVSFLRSASIIVTHRCNATCYACGYGHNKDSRIINPKIIYNLLPEFSKCGIRNVTWTGGEPTLHPLLPELMNVCYQAGMKNTLITNGSTFNQTFHELASSIQDVIISLDASNANDYKEIRGLDCFEDLVKIPEKIKTNYPWVAVTVCTLLQKKNIDKIDDFISLVSSTPVDTVAFLVPDLFGFQNTSKRGRSFGRQDQDSQYCLEAILPTRGQLSRFYKNIPDISARLDSISTLSSPSSVYLKRYYDYFMSFLNGIPPVENPLCALPHTNIIVTVDGKLKPCFFIPECFPIADVEDPLHSEDVENCRQRLMMDTQTRERSCRWCMQVARRYDKIEKS